MTANIVFVLVFEPALATLARPAGFFAVEPGDASPPRGRAAQAKTRPEDRAKARVL
jgi:hypothetical protein